MFLRYRLPVIKIEGVSGDREPTPKSNNEARPDPFLNMPYELIMMYLLPLDPESVLNACFTSSTIRQICEADHFWKTKALQDFDLPEGFELPEEGGWKNYYFNRVFPEREFKQLIIDGKEGIAKELSISQRDNPNFDQSKMLLFVLERYDPRFDELIEEISMYIFQHIRMERDVGLNILCVLSAGGFGMGTLFDWFKLIRSSFGSYYNSEEDEMDVLRCAISGGNVDLIQIVYNAYISLHGIKGGAINPRVKPKVFVEYARTLDKTPEEIANIVQTIMKTYKSFERFMRRRL